MKIQAINYRENESMNDRKNDKKNEPVNEWEKVQETLKISQINQPYTIKADCQMNHDDITQFFKATIKYGNIERSYAMIEIDHGSGFINCYDDPNSEPVDIITVWNSEATEDLT